MSMDLFSMHADGVLRDLMQRQQQGGITGKMVRGGKQSFDPLRQGAGFTLPQKGFGFAKSGGFSLSSAKFRQIPKNVREVAEDMGEAKKQVSQNTAEAKKDQAVVVLGNVAAVDGSQESKQPVDDKQPPPATPKGKAAGAAGASGGGDAAGLAALVAQYQVVTSDKQRLYFLYEDLEGRLFDLGNVKKKAREKLGFTTSRTGSSRPWAASAAWGSTRS